MERNKQIWLLLVALGLVGCKVDATSPMAAHAAPLPPEPLELTVYKDDFALVHDIRKIQVTEGSSEVRLPGVSKMLDPNSVIFDWPGATSKPDVVSTTYVMGVGSSQDLVKRMIGQKVDMVWRGKDGKIGDKVTGTLEEAGQGTVLHTDDSYLIDPSGEIVAPGKENFPTMPSLVASVNSKTTGDQKVGISYLTRGLSWSADYVGVISPDEKTMRLECWGTITNLTGTDFPHAKLRLMAGNPNRAALNLETQTIRQAPAMAGNAAMSNGDVTFAKAPVAPQAAGELYAYNLPSEASVLQQQMNRAKIFTSEVVPITRSYSIALNNDTDAARVNATVGIAFNNSAKANLGQPLPGGTLRAYEPGATSQLSYTGAADIADTPKNERVSLTLSDAFDVYAKPKKTSVKRLNKHKVAETFTVEVHNEKKKDAEIKVNFSFGEAGTIQTENLKSQKTAYDSFQWKVPTPSNATKTLSFTVVLTS